MRVDCGDFSTCAIAEGGSVRCWGRDKKGELGDGGGPDRSNNAAVPGLGRATALALGSEFGCALQDDKKIRCWGTGRIANDGKVHQRARATEVSGVDGALDIVASGLIACARTTSGVTCWGGEPKTIGTPPSGAFSQIATGFTHACGLDDKGGISCWGTGDWAPRGSFSKPPITGAKYVATGDRHACVITRDNKVACWGQNDAGQLGVRADTEGHKKPVEVPGIDGIVKLVAGESATCAIDGNGTVRCWGGNSEGELGLGKRSSDERPTKLSSVAQVADVCLATTHGCALTKDAKIVCWGGNADGQLGDGSKDRKLEPSNVRW
ncbi:regulator of chromosome condensation, RCC1 [Labilithrix luteola]|uniref:Regulator of chromosome condensation, RCC1 n=1 Tax=Labilithrix luteola TaxID=1391654 RepID=A0A0K1PM81_9BACT|nr:regulator of chromosome condensation, RCC1 [Labilithrix luteola]